MTGRVVLICILFASATLLVFNPVLPVYAQTLFAKCTAATVATSENCTISGHIPSGAVIVVGQDDATAAASSVPTDNASNTYTQKIEKDCLSCSGLNSYWTAIYTTTVSSAGGLTVTIHATAETNTMVLQVYAVTGIGATPAATATSNCSSSCTSPISTSTSISGTNDFVVSTYRGAQQPSSAGSGFTLFVASPQTDNSGGEYSTTINGNTNFPYTLAANPVGYAYSAAAFAPSSVTVTGKCTMSPVGATQDTVTLSGAAVSPTTLACDGNTHTLTANPSATITATVGSAAANQLYKFNTAGTLTTTLTFGTGAAGGNMFFHDYLTDTVTASYSGTVNTAPILHFTSGGNTTTYTLTTSGTNKQADDGTSWTITKASNFPSATERYDTGYANSSASAGQTIAPVFYHQFTATLNNGLTGSCTLFGAANACPAPGWFDTGTQITSTGHAAVTWPADTGAVLIYQGACPDGTQIHSTATITGLSCQQNPGQFSFTDGTDTVQVFIPAQYSTVTIHEASGTCAPTKTAVSGGNVYSCIYSGSSGTWTVGYSGGGNNGGGGGPYPGGGGGSTTTSAVSSSSVAIPNFWVLIQVKDPCSNTIKNVNLTLIENGMQCTTGNAGACAINNVPKGQYHIQAIFPPGQYCKTATLTITTTTTATATIPVTTTVISLSTITQTNVTTTTVTTASTATLGPFPVSNNTAVFISGGGGSTPTLSSGVATDPNFQIAPPCAQTTTYSNQTVSPINVGCTTILPAAVNISLFALLLVVAITAVGFFGSKKKGFGSSRKTGNPWR